LRELDLEVREGEILAVVGRNGAGKSTLLKIAAGVTKTTTGHIRLPDRIAPLIEVGAGFHPELSGRENVEVNGRLLGLSPKEIRTAFDEIVAFAQLEHAIDQPVRQYSSGMFMRLGFAVAIHTRPELLIVDEVLAVGDMPFQVRCLDRIRELRAEGVGVLFVSHNLTAVLSLADRAIFLQQGQLRAEGEVTDVVGAYHQSLGQEIELGDVDPSGRLALDSIQVTDESGEEPPLWRPGDRATITLHLRAVHDTDEGLVGYRFVKDGAGMVARWIAEEGPFVPPMREGETTEVTTTVSLNFAEGGYLLDVAIGPRDHSELNLSADGVYRFGVANRPGGTGIVDVSPAMAVRPLR
jgi:ABC-type polysaccharide/polyol phosphate transport system ATPase subunit